MACGGVGCSTSTSGMPIRAASARALSAHTPFSSPAASLVYCGRNRPTRTLPFCTRSATRASDVGCAPAVPALASKAASASDIVNFPIIEPLHFQLTDCRCIYI